MPPYLADLLSISGASICDSQIDIGFFGNWGKLGRELTKVLERRNGFYAYDSSLLIRPSSNTGDPFGIIEWNQFDLWKFEGDHKFADALFFAEDLFGNQFCIFEDIVCAFDPETGLFETLSDSLDSWAEIILTDPNFRTGYSIAHAWQIKYGPLPLGTRLAPKVPFVLGGQYELENLSPTNEVETVGFRLSIAMQIRNLPDGTKIALKRGQ